MAKLSREEFKSKYNGLITDNDDLLIGLFEDIDDSFPDNSDEINRLQSELADRDQKYNDLQEKYKSRFLESTTEASQETIVDEVEEKEYIDVKEI